MGAVPKLIAIAKRALGSLHCLFCSAKTNDLEILLIGLQSLIQSFNYFKKTSLNNGLNSINSDISFFQVAYELAIADFIYSRSSINASYP